ncbi:DUF6817 domain-containing protein [Paraglaciecola aestuariivivens]
MDQIFLKLIQLGAGKFEHADAKLIAHLEGTACLLKEWHAREELQQAGLYHLVYSTSADKKITPAQRQDVATVIGDKIEKLLYDFYQCEALGVFEPSANQNSKASELLASISNKVAISQQRLAQLTELKAAIMVDKCIYAPEYARPDTGALAYLFKALESLLSESAKRKIAFVLATFSAPNT